MMISPFLSLVLPRPYEIYNSERTKTQKGEADKRYMTQSPINWGIEPIYAKRNLKTTSLEGEVCGH
jgi:hypothetical protein